MLYGQSSLATVMIKPGRTKASAMLDLLRGLAALMVCLGHWRNVLFIDYNQRTGHGLWARAFYGVTSCGHQSVVIFFVLSGYLIAGSVRRAVESGTWNWRRYGVQRVARLWVVLIPGLLLCALWDHLGMRSGWAPRLYGGLSGDHMILNVAQDETWAAFWRTLFFLHEILGRTFGSDGPLWSLAYEFWYYVLFPLGFFLILPGVRARVRVLCLALLIAAAWMQGHEMLTFFPIWLAGAALTYLPACRAGALQRWAAALAYLPIFLLASRYERVLGPPTASTALLGDYTVGVCTMALLWVLLSARQPQTGTAWERVGQGLAPFSYTLYVTHTPLLVLLAAWAARDQRWQLDLRHLSLAVGMLVLLLVYAWTVAWATEFRTDKVRCWAECTLIGRWI